MKPRGRPDNYDQNIGNLNLKEYYLEEALASRVEILRNQVEGERKMKKNLTKY